MKTIIGTWPFLILSGKALAASPIGPPVVMGSFVPPSKLMAKFLGTHSNWKIKIGNLIGKSKWNLEGIKREPW